MTPLFRNWGEPGEGASSSPFLTSNTQQAQSIAWSKVASCASPSQGYGRILKASIREEFIELTGDPGGLYHGILFLQKNKCNLGRQRKFSHQFNSLSREVTELERRLA